MQPNTQTVSVTPEIVKTEPVSRNLFSTAVVFIPAPREEVSNG